MSDSDLSKAKMKTRNPKMYRMCGQHINASDDNCPDLARHAFTEYDYQQQQKAEAKMTKNLRGDIHFKVTETKPQHQAERVERGTSEHTPTPWDVEYFQNADTWGISGFTKSVIEPTSSLAKADAEYIVRAVNAYDALVAERASLSSINEELLEVVKALRSRANETCGASDLIEQVDRAIAKAEGILKHEEISGRNEGD